MSILPPSATLEESTPSPRRAGLLYRRFMTNRLAIVGLVTILILFLYAFITPLVSPVSANEMDFTALSSPPSLAHLFGTNNLGQDIFVRTAVGLQKSLLIGLFVALLAALIAGVLGAVAGYFGGWTELIIIFTIDLLLTLPAFMFIAILSPKLRELGWFSLVFVIAIFGWMITARVIRSMAISLRNQEYVRAARYMGISHMRIIFRHILPQLSSFIVVDATIAAGGAVMTETGLSYFGFGIQAPDVSIGNLISSGQQGAFASPWLWGFALLALIIFVLATNLVGDGLRDAFDPTSGAGSRRSRRSARKAARA